MNRKLSNLTRQTITSKIFKSKKEMNILVGQRYAEIMAKMFYIRKPTKRRSLIAD